MALTTQVGRQFERGVELWLLDLDATSRDLSEREALAVLSDAERRRAAALPDDARRRRFVASRVALRAVLGRALEVAPGDVELSIGSQGRPELAGSRAEAPRFNLSHSDRLCLIALRRGGQVGVDLQRTAAGRPWERLLERICGPAELEEARNEVGELGRLAFYERWVAKEAALKGLGRGLSVSPTRVRLRRGTDRALGLVELPGRTDAADAWRLRALQVPSGFVAALALDM